MKKLIYILLIFIPLGVAHAQSGEPYQLSTHILDTGRGVPAKGVIISLYKYNAENLDWVFVDKAVSDSAGRIPGLLSLSEDNFGAYRLRFETEEYFKTQGLKTIYPYIEVTFYITDKTHFHIPVTASANGYSTYRGS